MKVIEILKRKENLNVPNILSIFRIILIGVLIIFFVEDMYIYAFFTYVLASMTDIVDGYIARRYNLITSLGKLLDPMADKLMLISVLICMYLEGWIHLWILIVIFGKELIQVMGSFALYKSRDMVVQSNIMGKLTTALFSVSIALLFFHDAVTPYDTYALVFTVIFALITLIQYFYYYIKNSTKRVKVALNNPINEHANQE